MKHYELVCCVRMYVLAVAHVGYLPLSWLSCMALSDRCKEVIRMKGVLFRFNHRVLFLLVLIVIPMARPYWADAT